MKVYMGKVAVVTGAARGIGRALAARCLQKGMKVVLADIDADALNQAGAALETSESELLSVQTDVSNANDVADLAGKTFDRFGNVHLLFNNAGVGVGSSIWESTLNDCKWVIGVNLWGIINCIHAFLPAMLDQDSDGHIVNTSSIAGLLGFHPSALYQLTKHGIVALSEHLHHDLAMRGANVGVSVLCPGFVNTNIMNAESYRPPKYENAPGESSQEYETDQLEQEFREMVKAGMAPDDVADRVFEAIEQEKFYIFTHPEMSALIKSRMEDILQARNPTPPS